MYIFMEPYEDPACYSQERLKTALCIGDCFQTIVHNKAEYCRETCAALMQFGITLSEERIYILARFESEQPWDVTKLCSGQASKLLEGIHNLFGAVFQIHVFTSDGMLYMLIELEAPFQGEWFHRQFTACCRRLLGALSNDRLYVLVSQEQNGAQGIFHAANSVRFGADYIRFFHDHPALTFLDLEEQTAISNAGDQTDYQKLAASIAEALSDPDFDAVSAATDLLEIFKKRSACSIEALHRQMQNYSTIFLNYLIDCTIVDERFIRNNRIRQDIMGGDTDGLFIQHHANILKLLHERRLELAEKYDLIHLQEVFKYTEGNITDQTLSVSQIADHFRVNRSQLTAQFRSYYGETLAEFIHRKRLERACMLIKSHRTWTLDKVAEASGYCNLSTMYRAFQRGGLSSPAVYRDL